LESPVATIAIPPIIRKAKTGALTATAPALIP
jgi:hypothetical protein